jgi:iduronate 2-sulfatase
MIARRWFMQASIGALTALALAGPLGAAEASEAAGRRPNVLLIMSDDLGARLGAYGHRQVHTPNIDRLAGEGVVFQHAYTQFPQCAQSRASMLTGRRPSATRVLDLRTNFRAALPDALTLPQLFRQNGYFAGRVGKIYHQGVPGDIGQSGPDDPPSWDEVVNPSGRDKEAERAGRLVNVTPGVPLGTAMAFLADEGSDAEQTDGMVADEAIRMIERHKDGPFFIGVGFYRPHVPDVAPRAYFDRYPLEKIELEKETPKDLANLPQTTARVLPANFDATPDEQRRMIQAYYAATSFMDAQVGRVLGAVKRLGLADNTIVVFVSDHGYLLGEHGQWGKLVLWEQAVRTPLIIRAPRAARAGRSVAAPVELLDIYPTLAELVGLSPPKDLEGASLAPLLRNPKAAWDRPAFSQVVGGRSVRHGRWRYTEWEGGRLGASLHDLEADPKERRDLVGDPKQAATVARLSPLVRAEPVERRDSLFYYDRKAETFRAIPLGPPGTRAGDTKP